MFQRAVKFRDFVGSRVWKLLWVAIFVGFMWFAIESFFVIVFQGFLVSVELIDRQMTTLPSWYPTGTIPSLVMLLGYGFFRFVVFVIRTAIGNMAGQYFLCEQRSRILKFALENAHRVNMKEIVGMFTDNLSQGSGIIQQLINLCVAFVSTILFFGFGLKIAPVEMLTSVFLLAVLLFPFRLLARQIDQAGLVVAREWENVSGSLIQGMKNFFLLRVYDMISTEERRGSQSLRTYRDHHSRYGWIVAVSGGVPLLIGVFVIAVVTYLSKSYWNTPPMTLVSFFYIFIRLAQSASDLNMTMGNIRVYRPSFLRIFHWNRENVTKELAVETRPEISIEEVTSIEFENVSFSYDGDRPILKDVSFRLEKPFRLVIRGESGSGKSTLLSLLVGLLHPMSGRILINGKDLRTSRLNFHRVLAYAGPEPFLIADTVRNNLLYGLSRSSVPDSEIWDFLERFEMGPAIRDLPKKLDEKLMEISQLSTGQRQRLSLARAALRAPSLFLMDEPTANLDDETESKIISELFGNQADTSFVIVTHKNSFDKYASKIIELKSTKN